MKISDERVRAAMATYGEANPNAYQMSRMRAALEAAVGEMVLVPREPTEEMRTAHSMYGDTSDWWNALLAAANGEG